MKDILLIISLFYIIFGMGIVFDMTLYIVENNKIKRYHILSSIIFLPFTIIILFTILILILIRLLVNSKLGEWLNKEVK